MEKPSERAGSGASGTTGFTVEGEVFPVGLTGTGTTNVDVRASGDGGHLTVSCVSVYFTFVAPGADVTLSSGTDTGVDGSLLRPRVLTPTTK